MLALPWNSVVLSAILFPVLDLPRCLFFLGKNKIPKRECQRSRSKKIAGSPRFASARTSLAAVTCPRITHMLPTLYILTVISCQKNWDVPVSLCMDGFVGLTPAISVKLSKS